MKLRCKISVVVAIASALPCRCRERMMPTRVAEHESRNDSQSQTQPCDTVRAKGKTFEIASVLVASSDSICSRSRFRRHISKTALHPKAAIVRGNIFIVKIFAVCVFLYRVATHSLVCPQFKLGNSNCQEGYQKFSRKCYGIAKV